MEISKRIISLLMTVLLLVTSFLCISASATETSTEKTEYIYIRVSIDDNKPNPEYIYTGKPIKPNFTLTRSDGKVLDEDDCIITYNPDSTTPGRKYMLVTEKASGAIGQASFKIVVDKTKRVDLKVENSKVTLSWAAVDAAKAYRVLMYDESEGKYVELYWEDGSIASPKLSRTFTDLKAGKTYKMAIMALASAIDMPTKVMTEFTFTVPSGNTSMNLVPGIPAKVTTTKPTTTKATTAKPTTEATTETTTESTTETITETTTETTVKTTTDGSTTKPTTSEKETVTQKAENGKETSFGLFIGIACAVIIIVAALVIIKKSQKKN